ncbi:hypothetical protein SCCGRSA3_02286 [Marine Group I thaumarchaeote SCGC RSA3]|uniref:Uncharacterized protein n=3 Tax=Marine Group I TaxID=905826 RepID=A0A081RNP9_9ARCH|nr:hypothetical protein AAA799N04_00651 [Marine Group I thaumarchaeote SCGC AAA799-N04]KFM15218.1 hypothetical protein AAA799D11_01399 [Marine Group I thaumarchaeote SCGC AAA799-D11]KFM16497.1 hypothetical protein SCCGRSA3_02286 [Marine Group I thaumarchaeote SCGC RSA3]
MQEILMLKFVLGAFLVFLLIPFSQSFAQVTDTPSTLSVSITSEAPFVYQDSDGYTVVVGTVKNHNTQTSVTNVLIQVNFFDDISPNPLEVNSGRTTLEVIPPNGESPFSIRSETPNPQITGASVSLLGFDSSSSKQKGLTVYSSEISYDNRLNFKGVLQNSGAPNSNTNVYLALYDGFEPPRTLDVITVELGDVEPDGEVSFTVNQPIDARAVGFLLFAESDVFTSNFVDVEIPEPQSLTKLVSITNVSVTNSQGEKLSEIPVGSIVNVRSEAWIQFAADQTTNETPYTYYIQIKEAGTGKVEYIGKDDGRFIGTGLQYPTIDWMPKNSGLYFLETFVWDRNDIPIAEQGPFVLINVK